MLYLATFNWGWMVAAALCGFGMGWISVVQRGQGFSDATMKKCGVLLGVAILVSLLRLVPGRAGYWLDLGLVMFVVYLAGCAFGSRLRALVVSRLAPPA
ncbi:MAG: hypothetical protein HY242_14735 [Afipia sp.]|nr:hypothetical protein [Afipia sp.]